MTDDILLYFALRGEMDHEEAMQIIWANILFALDLEEVD